MFKKIFNKITNLKGIKPLPGSGILNEFSELKEAWNEGKKIKGAIRIAVYILGAVLLWYLIEQGIVTTLPEVLEYIKAVL